LSLVVSDKIQFDINLMESRKLFTKVAIMHTNMIKAEKMKYIRHPVNPFVSSLPREGSDGRAKRQIILIKLMTTPVIP
jgi:hypothetical protein